MTINTNAFMKFASMMNVTGYKVINNRTGEIDKIDDLFMMCNDYNGYKVDDIQIGNGTRQDMIVYIEG